MLVIGAAFAVLVLAIAELRRTTQRSTTSQEVLGGANTLERLVIDLETGARGYIITGDERFLAPWEAARTAVPRQSSELERLATGMAQHERAQRIAAAVASYVRDYSVPLVDAVRRHETTGRSLATTADGKRRVDAIRGGFDRFMAAETAFPGRARIARTRRRVGPRSPSRPGSRAPSCWCFSTRATSCGRSSGRSSGWPPWPADSPAATSRCGPPRTGPVRSARSSARSTTWHALWKRAATTCTFSPKNSRRCDASRRSWRAVTRRLTSSPPSYRGVPAAGGGNHHVLPV